MLSIFLSIVFALVAVVLVVLLVTKATQVIPQARAANVERLGRYLRTLEPGLNFVVPFLDRVKPQIDLRETVMSFSDQRVITEDNLVVHIDTVLFFQVTDPRAADYEIFDYAKAIGQLSATMLRSVIGSMDLEQTLTSRDRINAMLRGVLDEASGKWGIRVTRVEIKALDPAPSIMDAMEKQYRAQREKRAAILSAEGEKQAAILKSEGQATAIEKTFKAIHDGRPDPELLAYQYVQALPQVAQSQGSTVWVIPSEVTTALRTLSSAFGNSHREDPGVGRGLDVPPLGPRSLPGLSDARSAGDGGPISGQPDDGGEPGAGTEPGAGGPSKAA
ncbi:MAG TPA: SPFH domain-containing protein [Streptosporangiaceae bacterium]|nr:SPFH domain-containing protein [Streptosporangiaceae bacterium]